MERDERIHRWIDGELDEAERARFEAELAADPRLREEVEAVGRLGDLLRSHLPAERVPDPVEAFHAAVSRGIAESAAPPEEGEPSAGGDPGPAFAPVAATASVPAGGGPARSVVPSVPPGDSGRVIRFPLPWLVAAAACLVAGFLLWRQAGVESGAGRPRLVDAYAPDPRIHAEVFFDDAAGATVILLDGLDELPEDRDVTPYSVASHPARPAGSGHAPVLLAAGEDDRPVFVLRPEAGGRVTIREVKTP